ncbi:MAG: hypothetical protein AAF960_25300 [Bacteroidota bacterium]
MKKINFLFVCLFLTTISWGQKSEIPNNYALVYAQDFQYPQSLNEFEMTDRMAWKWEAAADKRTLSLYGKSNYEAKVRAPFNIALIKELIVGDFVLEVELAQSGKEYGHRDLCLFFNVKDPTNYYYVHIASKMDARANNIFIVNDEPRVKISTKTTNGTNWGPTNSWHTARIERNVTEGTIRVYFDDMNAPIMEASDTHFTRGRIGFGSFDDTGRFDNIKIWAPKVFKEKDGFFANSNIKN